MCGCVLWIQKDYFVTLNVDIQSYILLLIVKHFFQLTVSNLKKKILLKCAKLNILLCTYFQTGIYVNMDINNFLSHLLRLKSRHIRSQGYIS